MENQMKKTSDEIRQLTQKRMAELIGTWRILFEEEIVLQNIVKLGEHVKQFYEDICEETANRKDKIEQKVASLVNEHNRLTTMLHVRSIALPPPDQTALYTYQCSLDQSLQDLRDKVKERRERIEKAETRELELCAKIDLPVKSLQCPETHLPSEEEVEDFELYVHQLQVQYENRCEEMANLRFQIQTIASEIELDVSRSILMSPTIQVSASNCNALRSYLEQVCDEKNNIKSVIDEKWKTLQSLYECLDTSPRSRIASVQPLTKTTVSKLDAETLRCEKVKRQNVKRIIEKVRERIEEYWELNMMSDKERARFSNFTNDCYTEDLLMLHEMELNDLQQFYSANQHVFDKYKLHMELWDRAIALESRENDPNRYKNRGGNLLLEEKERRTVAQRLAKVRTELERIASEYEAEKRRPFTIRGANMVESIDELYNVRRLAKEQQTSARKATISSRIHRMAPTASMLATSTMSAPRIAASARTPMSTTRLESRSGLLKRAASTTKLNFPVSVSKKPKIIITTPAKTIKRSILNELTASNTPNIQPPKFRKPAPRKPTKVIDTLTMNGARRKSSQARRRSHNRSKVVSSDASENSYVQFAEEVPVRSRSSVKPKVARAIKARPQSPRFLNVDMSSPKPPMTSNRSSPRAKLLQNTLNTPSPGIKKLPEFF